MSLSPNPLLAVGTESLHGDAHFLQAIAAMSQHQPMVLSDAVYTVDGMRLGEKGAPLNRALCERLVRERLRRPIDELVELSDPVDIPTLEAEVMTQCETAVLPRLLMQALGQAEQWRLLAPLTDMPWPVQARFKLSVMRSQRTELYGHSLAIMLVAVYLGVREDLNDDQLAQLAAAALWHDVGMLFMDPSWTNPRHQLTQEERRHLAAHTVTSMLAVRAAGVYHQEVEMAVLEHHERMDGSGYPRSVTGDHLSLLGRILMLAEVVAAFFDKYAGDMPALRLSLMLRLNRRRFPEPLVEHVMGLLRHASEAAPLDAQPLAADVRHSMVALSMLIDHWKRKRNQLPPKWQLLPCGRAGLFMDLRMASLESALAEAGSLPQQQIAMLHLMQRDPGTLNEQAMINREALWQLESCIHTCLRRWPQVNAKEDAVAQAVAEWAKQAQAVLSGKRPGGRPAFFA